MGSNAARYVSALRYTRFDQSLFARFVRLGVARVELDAQGRARPSLAKLYNWRYTKYVCCVEVDGVLIYINVPLLLLTLLYFAA